MHLRLWAFCLGLACLSTLPAFNAPVIKEKKTDEDQGTVAGTIQMTIRLIEEKKYKELIETLAAPRDLEELKKSKEYEEIIEKFGKDKAGKLLEVFKAIAKKEPSYNDAKDVARFESNIKDAPRNGKITLRKVDGKWYIADRDN
jgi:hypothetical protein